MANQILMLEQMRLQGGVHLEAYWCVHGRGCRGGRFLMESHLDGVEG